MPSPIKPLTSHQDNHKPSFSTDSARARLKPAAGSSQQNSYDLNFLGADGRTEYAFTGARTVGDGRYVLYFDPKREAFILDRMDSTFHMNLTRTPSNSDPDSLARRYPHLDEASTKGSSSSAKPEKTIKAKPARAKSPPARKKDPPARKQERKAPPQAKNINLALPQAGKTGGKPKTKPQSRPAEDEEDEEDEGDDDLLLVEYPGGDPSKSQSRDFSPAFPSVRRFDDFMDQRESEADDADGESLGEPDTDFKLPSPVNNHPQTDDEDEDDEPELMDVDYGQQQQQQQQNHHDGGEDAGSPNLEDDLEKDLAEAFEAVANSQNGTPADGDESEISEED